MTKTIRVTQKNIDDAKEILDKDAHNRSLVCAITQAFKDAGYPKSQSVYGFCFLEGASNPSFKAVLPFEVMEWMSNFDNGKPVSPFSFKVEIKGS